ncbi:restriction endonuclease subunit S [Empedobacter falsenii]
MENLQPKLRFPEFKDDWSNSEINNILNYVDYRGKTPEKVENGILLITAKNIKFGYIDYEVSKEYINPKDYNEVMRRGLPKKGDILITTEAPLGNVAQIDNENIALAQRVIKYSAKEKTIINNDFIKHIFLSDTFQKKLLEKASGSTALGIKGKELHKLNLSYPTLQEQTKIADFLGAVDKQLDILNQKKEKLNLYKKGVMQQLFSQQLRFKDDNGNNFPDWEEKRLLDFENLIHGDGDWILAKDIDSEGNINVIQLGNIGKGNFIDKDYKKITIETFNEIKGTPIKKGDLLINRMLNNYKLHSCLFPYNGDYITSVDVCWIRENNYFNNYFLKSLFSWEKSQEIFVSLSSGSGRIRISKKNLFERFVFKLPSIEEQTKIANLLSAIDTQIEAVENQITKTETYKKGLLQQMFV